MRDKLIEICDTNNGWVDEIPAEQFADYLSENDVVKVVRCKDCKHFSENDTTRYCEFHSTYWEKFIMRRTDYCSYGERKE